MESSPTSNGSGIPRWAELHPEPSVIIALDHAGDRPPDTAGREERHAWSNSFADACAVAIATEFRKTRLAKNKKILPESIAHGTEPVTPLGSGTSKRIDVTITDAVLGLEVGVSLKGLNFKDQKGLNYDKNLTGRLYELGDEVRLVHEHLPHCFMVGIFFLPVEGSDDKKSTTSSSSFANTVIKLRGRTGRLDVALGGQATRCDASFVGLYATGEEGLRRGVVRFFDTSNPPPKRGRPRVSDTLSLSELITDIIARATFEAKIEWGPAEADVEGELESPAQPAGLADLEELLALDDPQEDDSASTGASL